MNQPNVSSRIPPWAPFLGGAFGVAAIQKLEISITWLLGLPAFICTVALLWRFKRQLVALFFNIYQIKYYCSILKKQKKIRVPYHAWLTNAQVLIKKFKPQPRSVLIIGERISSQALLIFARHELKNVVKVEKNDDAVVCGVRADNGHCYYLNADNDNKKDWLKALKKIKQHRWHKGPTQIVVSINVNQLMQAKTLYPWYEHIKNQLTEIRKVFNKNIPVIFCVGNCDSVDGFKRFKENLLSCDVYRLWGVQLVKKDTATTSAEHLLNDLCARVLAGIKKQITHAPAGAMAELLIFGRQLTVIINQLNKVINHTIHKNSYAIDVAGCFFVDSVSNNKSEQATLTQAFFNELLLGHRFKHQTTRAIHKWINFKKPVIYCLALLIAAVVVIQSVSFTVKTTDYNNKIKSSLEHLYYQLSLSPAQLAMDKLLDEHNVFPDCQSKTSLSRLLGFRYACLQQQQLFAQAILPLIEKTLIIPNKKLLLQNMQKLIKSLHATKFNIKAHSQLYRNLTNLITLFSPLPKDSDKLAEAFIHLNANNNQHFISLAKRKTETLIRSYFTIIAQRKENPLTVTREDKKIIDKARNIFKQLDVCDYLLLRILVNQHAAMLNPLKLLPARFAQVWRTDYPIPQVFSQAGFNETVSDYFKQPLKLLQQPDPVLNLDSFYQDLTADELEDIKSKLYQRYAVLYEGYWATFLQQLSWPYDRHLSRLQQRLDLLTQRKGAFYYLIQLLDNQLSLLQRHEFKNTHSQKTRQVISHWQASGWFSRKHHWQKMQKAYQAIDVELTKIGKTPSYAVIKQYAQNHFNPDAPPNALHKAMQTLEALTDDNRQAVAKGLKQTLKAPIMASFSWFLEVSAHKINHAWREELWPFYRQHLFAKYPFVAAKEDVNFNHFAYFFKPGEGLLARFEERYLSPFITKTANKIAFKRWQRQALPLTTDALSTFNVAKLIQQTFFNRSTNQFILPLKLYPYPTKGVDSVTLNIDTERLRYRNEPQEWHKLKWPSLDDAIGASLSIRTNKGSETLEYPGGWGLMRLLAQGKVVSQNGHEKRLRFYFPRRKTFIYLKVAGKNGLPWVFPEAFTKLSFQENLIHPNLSFS